MRTMALCAAVAALVACERKVVMAPIGGRAEPAALTQPCVTATLPIITYHRVTDRVKSHMAVSSSLFTQHMQYLKDHGYTPVTMEDWYLAAVYGLALPPKPVAITFDDAWPDQYDVAAPILKQFGYRATFYAYTAVMGTAAMSWEKLKALAVQGHCIGSHTAMHSDVARKKKDESDAAYASRLVKEIVVARQDLEAHLGVAVRHFCYPYGYYNTNIVAMLKQAQFATATTVNPSVNTGTTPLMMLGRTVVGPWVTAKQLGAFLDQRPFGVARLVPDDGVIQTGATTRVMVTLPERVAYLPSTLRMKWNWKWADSTWDPATRTVTHTLAAPLTPGIYCVQVHAWDAQSNHYAHAWLFQQGSADMRPPVELEPMVPEDTGYEQAQDPDLILLHSKRSTR